MHGVTHPPSPTTPCALGAQGQGGRRLDVGGGALPARAPKEGGQWDGSWEEEVGRLTGRAHGVAPLSWTPWHHGEARARASTL